MGVSGSIAKDKVTSGINILLTPGVSTFDATTLVGVLRKRGIALMTDVMYDIRCGQKVFFGRRASCTLLLQEAHRQSG